MPKAVAIALDLPKPIAEALLLCLRTELQRGLQAHWYDDRYRYTPAGLRGPLILAEYPALAGCKQTIAAVAAALNSAA